MTITSDMNEAAVRRLARKHNLSLCKSRSRTPDDPSFGGCMIVDPYRNVVVEGARHLAYSLTLGEAAEALQEIVAS